MKLSTSWLFKCKKFNGPHFREGQVVSLFPKGCNLARVCEEQLCVRPKPYKPVHVLGSEGHCLSSVWMLETLGSGNLRGQERIGWLQWWSTRWLFCLRYHKEGSPGEARKASRWSNQGYCCCWQKICSLIKTVATKKGAGFGITAFFLYWKIIETAGWVF